MIALYYIYCIYTRRVKQEQSHRSSDYRRRIEIKTEKENLTMPISLFTHKLYTIDVGTWKYTGRGRFFPRICEYLYRNVYDILGIITYVYSKHTEKYSVIDQLLYKCHRSYVK